MATRENPGNTNYWGLVQQQGPWRSVARDRTNATSSLSNKFFRGGGVQGGGTKNAGNGGWYSEMTPYPAYGVRGPPPKPTRYAQRKVTFTSPKYIQSVGKPAVGASYPESGGQFAGSKPRTEQVFQLGGGQRLSGALPPISIRNEEEEETTPDLFISTSASSDLSNPFSDVNMVEESDIMAGALKNALAEYATNVKEGNQVPSHLGKHPGEGMENDGKRYAMIGSVTEPPPGQPAPTYHPIAAIEDAHMSPLSPSLLPHLGKHGHDFEFLQRKTKQAHVDVLMRGRNNLAPSNLGKHSREDEMSFGGNKKGAGLDVLAKGRENLQQHLSGRNSDFDSIMKKQLEGRKTPLIDHNNIYQFTLTAPQPSNAVARVPPSIRAITRRWK